MTQDVGARSWKYRRTSVFLALGGAMAGIGYLIVWGEDNALHREIAGGLVNVIWLVIGIYVGGATGDDFLRDKVAKQ